MEGFVGRDCDAVAHLLPRRHRHTNRHEQPPDNFVLRNPSRPINVSTEKIAPATKVPFGPMASQTPPAITLAARRAMPVTRLTASKAIGEIGADLMPRLALAAMSASAKNWRRA